MTYRYTGPDAGIPGLPHLISDEQAAALDLTDLLQAALEAGQYAPVSAETPAFRRGKKPEPEVTHE